MRAILRRMAFPRGCAALFSFVFPVIAVAVAGAAQIRVAAGANASGASVAAGISASAGAVSGSGVLPGGLTVGLLPTPLAAVAAVGAPFALPSPSMGAAAPFSAAQGAVAAGARSGLGAAFESDVAARVAGDALFDARRSHLQADDAGTLVISGFRFNEATGRILAPRTGEPLTNAQVRAIRNLFHGERGRRTLLRLARETGPGGSVERKNALAAGNRDVLAREVLSARKAGPEKERATILRRLASLYRRWLERAPLTGEVVVMPMNAEAEEKLGALIGSAVVKRFSDDSEGMRLLDELRDEHGRLRLPMMRVLRLDARYGALYTPYGQQLILSLDYLKGFLLARLPEAGREEAAERLATEEGALAYLLADPARVAALAEDIDVTLFHELVHFRQDLEGPLMTAIQKEEAPLPMPLEYEYEAYFRQGLYIHSRLSHPNARLDIERLDDYLRLIDNFDAWKRHIDGYYAAHFLNSAAAMEELEKLQDQSQRLIRRLAGSEGRRSSAARVADAVAVEQRAAAAQLVEYRKRWPALARDGLRRWAQINAALGRWPGVALAQDRLASLAESSSDAAEWNEKAKSSANSALLRLASPEGLDTDERVEWINALAARYSALGEPWPKQLWVAFLRDFAQRARELRVEAGKSAEGLVQIELLRRAKKFESQVAANRAMLRAHAERNLALTRGETDPDRRAAAIEWGSMQASVLGDEDISTEFKRRYLFGK